jgi:hypothetical protein
MSRPWYPTSHLTEQDIIRKIMREAWMAGFNAKQIAGYFKLSLWSVYNKVNIRGLKRKKLITEYRKTLVN